MKRILIVDDELGVVRLLATLITRAFSHFEITQEHDWTKAISIIENVPAFDLVITDFRMPVGREGLSVIKAVKERSLATKVILISSDMTDREKEEAMPDKFLQKPFRNEILVAAIQELIPDIEARGA